MQTQVRQFLSQVDDLLSKEEMLDLFYMYHLWNLPFSFKVLLLL